MSEKTGSAPTVIRYSDEEYSSYDKVFLTISGTVSRFSNPRRRKLRGGQMKKRKRSSYVDIYYV